MRFHPQVKEKQLTFSKESNRVGVFFPSPGGGNRSSSLKVVFQSFLEYRTMNEVQIARDFEKLRVFFLLSYTRYHDKLSSINSAKFWISRPAPKLLAEARNREIVTQVVKTWIKEAKLSAGENKLLIRKYY
jgi:hypothetical protein